MAPKTPVLNESQFKSLNTRRRSKNFHKRKREIAKIRRSNGKQYENYKGIIVDAKIPPNEVS